MNYDDRFWKASIEELKQGYFYDGDAEEYVCLVCSKAYQDGEVYPFGDRLYSARKAADAHVREAHGSMFEYFLDMGKVYTGLTPNQRNLMVLFYDGFSDKEIVQKTEANTTSTIRNQRFALREKYKQAKIVVAMTELLEEKRALDKKAAKNDPQELVAIHRTATMIDERYAITQAEKDEVLGKHFDKENNLVIKKFPLKQKKKIIVLQHLMKEFEPNRQYSEKEVNGIIGRFYEDYVTVRRYMIEYGFLDRKADGSSYWVKF